MRFDDVILYNDQARIQFNPFFIVLHAGAGSIVITNDSYSNNYSYSNENLPYLMNYSTVQDMYKKTEPFPVA